MHTLWKISLSALLIAGCGHKTPPVAATEPSTKPTATDVDPATADVDYWLARPAVSSVPGADYDKLWAVAGQTLKAYRFALDRQDYRDGVLTTKPLTSKQFFEFWRHDTATARDTLQSSLGTMRRTVWVEFTRNPDGSATATPKVVVERFTTDEHRITAVSRYRGMLSPSERSSFAPPPSIREPGQDHWYAVGRDNHLEAELAKAMAGRLK